jgi:hypothetical protein
LGAEIILLNCCKWLQINRTVFRLVLIYRRAESGLRATQNRKRPRTVRPARIPIYG